MRHVVNFGLLGVFLALAITGLMAFTLPFSLTTARVHIIMGMAFVVLVLMHVFGRFPYFRKVVAAKPGAPLSPLKFIAIATAWVAMLAAAWLPVPPISWLISQSYEARNQAEIVRTSSLVGFEKVSPHRKIIVRKVQSPDSHPLSVSISFREHLQKLPATAVWAESTTGTLIETLYLDPTLAFADKVEWEGWLTKRNHILPIWRNRYTAISGKDANGKVDAVSGATESHLFAIDPYLKSGHENQFVLCVEINAPNDPNTAWTNQLIGQPSLLYTALIKVDQLSRYTLLELTGHGGGAEDNGNVQYDLEGFGSAKKLVDLLLVKLEETPEKIAE